MTPRTLPNPGAIFALRRQQAAEFRAGRKPDAGELPKRKPLSLAADKLMPEQSAARRKLPELRLCAGGPVQFF